MLCLLRPRRGSINKGQYKNIHLLSIDYAFRPDLALFLLFVAGYLVHTHLLFVS